MPAFFGNRAPELVPEVVMDLPIKPAQHHRIMPLKERSLSDLNKTNNGKPTIRLVSQDDTSIYSKSPLPVKQAHILSPPGHKNLIFQDESPTDGPQAREGSNMYGPRPHIPKKSANRHSVSTTTSNADTLVADSLFSLPTRRFSMDSVTKGPRALSPDYQQDHLSTLIEQSSELPDVHTSDAPDIPELRSSGAGPRHMAHSSSVYSSATFDELAAAAHVRRRSNSSGLGFSVAPIHEVSEADLPSSPPVTLIPRPDESISHAVRYFSSNDSPEPQYASIRPALHNVASTNSLWSAAGSISGNPEELNIPRKRGHVYSTSLGSYPSLHRLNQSHLSTIPSEAEGDLTWQSSAANIPRRRKTIAAGTYPDSVTSPKFSREIKPVSSSDTMSASVVSVSAIPQPLFSSSVPLPQRPFEPVHPSSTLLSDELNDTIGELPPAPLREKRSGYIVRQRSRTDLRPNSRPSNHTGQESDRWSTGSVIFPAWAQFFYAGKANLASANASRVTLAGPAYGSGEVSSMTLAGLPYNMLNASSRSLDTTRPSLRHQQSQASIATWTTRPESSHSNWETVYSESPASRMIGMFRGRSRPRSLTDYPRSGLRDDSSIDSRPPSPEIITIRPVPPRESSVRGQHPLRQNPAGPREDASKRTNTRARRSASEAVAIAPRPRAAPAPWMRSFTSVPRLASSRRLDRVLSTWRVPSIDEPFPSDILGRGNRQIVCFCLGFVLPPLWILAAVLPLPHCKWRGETQSGHYDEDQGHVNAQSHVEQEWSWDEERRFLKARWWRNLNRIMSVVGLGIIGAIIALAIFASRG